MFLLTYVFWNGMGLLLLDQITNGGFGLLLNQLNPSFLLFYIPVSAALVVLGILPALVCRSRVKYFIFVLCFFTSFTAVGGLMLMLWTLSENHRLDNELLAEQLINHHPYY